MQAELIGRDHKPGKLRRAWIWLLCFAEAMERSPMEDTFDRISRLERELASLKAERC
jgi:hypothetical protein